MSDAYTLPPWVPEEVSEVMKEWWEGRYHGTLSLNYTEGQVPRVNESRNRVVRAKPPLTVLCPDCRKPMESKDYDNLWVCACGRKVTKAQYLRGLRAIS